MKTITFLSVLFIIVISSCTTVYYTKSYEDANYLNQNEFSDFGDYTTNDVEYDDDKVASDTTEDGTIINNYYGDYYEADDYYDFSYSARIRRFHRPIWNIGYYGGLYTDYYWYSYNPYHCGMSIYYGYNYYSPFYSPYYSWGYYNYYNHHYGHHHYGHNNYYNNDTYSYNNSYDNNSIHYGPRSSLSSRINSNRSVKSVVNTANNKNSTYNKFDRMVDKKVTTRTIKTNPKDRVKTNTNRIVTKSITTKTSREIKTNTYKSNGKNHSTKGNRSYTPPKSNSNRSYNNSRGSSTKSSGNNRSSGSSGSKNRNVKPRK